MKISIIIPLYNSQEFIAKLMSSILNQKYKNFEIICVNDGSTDNTIRELEKYKEKCNKIKILNQENKGPGIARKCGFEKATGDLLFFVDSDDYLPDENVLLNINKIFVENNIDILFFDICKYCNNTESRISLLKGRNIKVGKNDIYRLKNQPIEGALWGKIFKREKMDVSFFVDSNNYEDYYTTYKYLNTCDNFYYTNQILYYANRDNPNSLTKKFSKEKSYKAIEVCNKIYEETKFKKVATKLIYEYYCYATRMIINQSKGENRRIELRKYTKYVNLMRLNFTYCKFKEIVKILIVFLFMI